MIVFTNEDSSHSLEGYHLIPSGVLTNGSLYYIKLSVFCLNNIGEPIQEDAVNIVNFKCCETPSVVFSNIPSCITNSSYGFLLQYTQPNEDYLYDYKVIMTDSNNNEVFNSGVLYNSRQESPLSFQVDIYNLEHGTYKISCSGTSVSGIPFQSKKCTVVVNYETPENYSLISAENKFDLCSIQLSSHIKVIEGVLQLGNAPIYIDGTKIDLRNDKLVFDDFSINNNFTLVLIVQDFKCFEDIIRISGNETNISVKGMYETIEDNIKDSFYLEVIVDNGLSQIDTNKSIQSLRYSTYSNDIDVKVTHEDNNIIVNTPIQINIVCQNNLIGVSIKKANRLI